MKKKGILLVLSAVTVGCLAGAWMMLKTQNEKAEQQESERAAGETILEVQAESLAGLSFETLSGTASFVLEDGVWKKTDDETFPVDEDALLAPLAQMEQLKAIRTLTEVENIEDFGFDEPQNQIILTGADGTETVLTIGAANENTGNDYLMMNEDTSAIYTIDSAVSSAFSENLYEYALSEELPIILAADISSVEVQRDSGGYHLYLEDALWKVKGDQTETAEYADAEMVNTELSSLSNPAYVDYLEHNCSDLSVYGLDEPAAIVTVSWMEEAETMSEETETEELPVTVEQQISFRVGSQDQSGNYYVQMEGSAQVHTMEAEVFQTFLSMSAGDWVSAEAETE